MTWAQKRQITYFFIFLSIVLAIGSIFILPRILKKSTCFDGKQNGVEAGVDCGGSCALVCRESVRDMSLLWARSFPVSGSVYNSVAYIENPNPNAGIERLKYEFRLYDENNVFITLREGEAYIGPNGKYAILEPGIDTGNRIPKRTTFSILDKNILWKAVPGDFVSKVSLRTSGETIQLLNGKLRVEADLINDSVYDIADVNISAVVYDKEDNAVAVSRTTRGELKAQSKNRLVFTWIQSFSEDPLRVELITSVNPYTLSF